MKRKYFTFQTLLLLLTFSFTTALGRTISGMVTDVQDGSALPGAVIKIKGSSKYVISNVKGFYSIEIPQGEVSLVFSFLGCETKNVKVGKQNVINVALSPVVNALKEVVVVGYGVQHKKDITGSVSVLKGRHFSLASPGYMAAPLEGKHNTEAYNAINDNRFLKATANPLSTFSIDVDAASYSNIRRYVTNKQLPPIDAVRIEEMVNYFNYSYPQPTGNDPVSVNTEIGAAPWNADHRLVKIGLKGKVVSTDDLPAANLVFLIDVSGSMASENRLPLLISSFKLLVDQLREQDKIAIVVYAGSSGLALPSTRGNQKQKIKEALSNLHAGGSTAGGEGIKLAYKVAEENFIKNGINRVILATDGDFNVGASSDAEMQRLIEEKRKSGVFLTALGYGMGNYKDSKLETLADKGNGNYAYIDNIQEAKKVLVKEFGGTLFTVAKDVKLQIEFNPAKVQAYRLIGYENRLLAKEDFNNDQKDAGELGAGQTVTALYEVIPVGVESDFIDDVDDLKYQKPAKRQVVSDDLLTIKLRYKNPDGDESKLMTKAISDTNVGWKACSDDYRFATAVAAYGMVLRNSEFKQGTNYRDVIKWTESAIGEDQLGYRKEFLQIVKASKVLAEELITVKAEEEEE
jgi:Ca-activated chloride channel family protein